MKNKFLWLVVLSVLLVTAACQISVPGLEAPQISSAQAQPTRQIDQPEKPAAPPVSTLPIPNSNLEKTQDILITLYEKVNPGVVSIDVLTEDGGGQGSGFVYDQEGHIVTNYHVVEDEKEVVVNFPSGDKVRGKVIGTDLDSDLAVIKVDEPAANLVPLSLGDSDQLKVGQMVVAIGNPYGLSSTMTLGIISAKGRILDSMRQTAEGRNFSAGDLLQTDASINPGNSGGPLLNLNGEVVGINRAIRTSGVSAIGEPINSGIGFAVSGNIVRRVVPVLIKSGKYDYPYLGVSAMSEISLFAKEALGLDRAIGAYVTDVVADGPVAKAGIRGGTTPTKVTGLLSGGDLIIGVDGRPVMVYGDLVSYLFTNKNPGDTITLRIVRDGKEMDVQVTLGKRP